MTAAPTRRSLVGLAVLVLAIAGGASAWRQHHEQALARELVASARPGDIEMLSSDTCVFCDRARSWLHDHGVPFGECSIEREPACAARYRAVGAPGTPVLLVRGQPQLGFNPDRVRDRLAMR